MKHTIHRFLLVLALCLASPGHAQDANNAVIAPYAQDLVGVGGDRLVPFKSGKFLKAPYTALYFSAGWCPDCRRFTPALVAAYNAQRVGEKRFEILLLTMDKTEDAMRKYMSSEKMTWPALDFAKRESAKDLQKYYSDHGIPCLTVIDPKGTVVLQSKSDLDATEILKQLQQLCAK
jgi:nucleoredoxin